MVTRIAAPLPGRGRMTPAVAHMAANRGQMDISSTTAANRLNPTQVLLRKALKHAAGSRRRTSTCWYVNRARMAARAGQVPPAEGVKQAERSEADQRARLQNADGETVESS